MCVCPGRGGGTLTTLSVQPNWVSCKHFPWLAAYANYTAKLTSFYELRAHSSLQFGQSMQDQNCQQQSHTKKNWMLLGNMWNFINVKTVVGTVPISNLVVVTIRLHKHLECNVRSVLNLKDSTRCVMLWLYMYQVYVCILIYTYRYLYVSKLRWWIESKF